MLAEEEVAIPTIYIQNATLAYGQAVVFSHLTIHLSAGDWIALLGPSGVGKSSFLRMIAGLTSSQETWQGQIFTDNGIPASHQIAYMAQKDLLLPWLTVLQNATLQLKLQAHSSATREAQRNQAKSLLEQVGLAKAMHLYPHQLSGGMRQRVALVRTLLENKPIVLMDEPFSALDAISRYRLQNLAAQLLKDKTVLFVTHDPSEALRLAHKIYIMQGQPAQLKPVASLSSTTPRELVDAEMTALQTSLFHELSFAGEFAGEDA